METRKAELIKSESRLVVTRAWGMDDGGQGIQISIIRWVNSRESDAQHDD